MMSDPSKATKIPEGAFRAAFLLPTLGGGGAERVYSDIANQLTEWGLSVDLVLLRATGTFLRRLDPRIRVVDLAVRSKPWSVFRLARYLSADPPHVLLSAMDVMNVTALLAKEFAGSKVPVVTTSHLHMSSQIEQERRVQDRAVRHLARWLYPRAERLIAVSRGVAADLVRNTRLDHGRVRVISNPIDLEAVRRSARDFPNHAWASDFPRPYLLSMGRLVPQKDFPTLFRALAEVRKRSDINLIVLGEGPQRRMLEGVAKDLGISNAVSMPGFVENPFPILSSAEALVLSSRFEGFGLVLLEALALGRQVVSTDCPSGPREILNDGRFGTLVPVGDVRALAEAIEATLQNPIDPIQLERRADAFSVERIAKQYVEVLEDVVGQTAKG